VSGAQNRADERSAAESRIDDGVLDDGGTFEDPVVVEPGSDARAFAATQAQPANAADEPTVGPLFADHDAHGFRDRWRDVQLRFVDDPKAAADEAATLVEQAVDALTANLRQQHRSLGAVAEADTEQLRVRLRGYRDFLDRLLAL
jgi:hypothetical protein